MLILPRSAWGAAPPLRRTYLPTSSLEGVTFHWFGTPRQAATHEGCDDLLRGVQAGHMAPGGLGTTNGANDIAYNHAICPHGYVYELRGFDVMTGANGTERGNLTHAAIVFMTGTGDPRLDASVLRLGAELRTEYLRRGCGTAVVPHSYWTGSTCPGPQLHAWVAAGGWKPAPAPPDPKETPVFPWLKDFLRWRIVDHGDPDKRPASVPADLTKFPGVWELATEMQKVSNELGMTPEERAWIHWRLVDKMAPDKRPAVPASIPKPWWADAEAVHKIGNAYAGKTA